MQLFLNRAKIFLHSDGKSGKRFVAQKGGPQQVPDWVKKSLTYKLGIKDKSILDLTPPPGSPSAEVADEPAKPAPKAKKLKGSDVGLTSESTTAVN